MEQIESQPAPTSEPVSILTVSSVPANTILEMITDPSSSTLAIEPAFSAMLTDPGSSVASMLISTEGSPQLTVSSAPLMTAPMTPSMIITTKPMETTPLGITRSPRVIEVEKEFLAKLVDSFFKSLSRCLKGSTTPFESLKVVLSRAIENIRDLRGADQATSLKLMVEELEKDMGEWRHLNDSDLTPLVEEEVKRLSEQMQKTYVEAQGEVEAVSQELKSLESEKIKIADATEASSNALAFTNDQEGRSSFVQN